MKVLYTSPTLAFFFLLFHQVSSAQTFNGVGGLPIPPGAPGQTVGITTSDAVVSGVGVLGGCNVIDNVTIDLEHSWVGDIALFLISPSGTVLELSSGNGGAGDNYQVTSFSDNAGAFITAGAPPYNGGFRPEGRQQDTNCPCSNANPLGTFTFANTFNGENADGTWQLLINDYVIADVGVINSWSITFSNNGTAPTANPASIATCLVNGAAIVDLTQVNGTVNGNTGLTVLWYQDMAATIPISNPGSYTVTGPTTVYAVVVENGCVSAPAPVTITVSPGPSANPATLTACDNGSGQAVFNLNSVANIVTGGAGGTVSWWTDALATIPIANPASYLSPAGTVYATVALGNCISNPVAITLQINPPLNTANTFITVNPLSGCGPTPVSATFTFPGTGPYNVVFLFGDPANPQPSNGVALTNGSVINFVLSTTTVFILTQVTDANGCTTILQNPQTITVTIGNPPAIFLLLTPFICTGESVDLSTLVTTNSGLPITFHTATPPNAGNQLPSPVVTPAASTIYYAFADAGAGCSTTVPIPVTVTQAALPQLLPANVCENENSFNLTALQDPAYPVGTWSGPGVSGNFFSAIGQTGTVALTFTPAAPCTLPGNTNITILPQATPLLSTANICESETNFNLTALQDPTLPGGTWSGPGVSGSSFNAAGQSGPVTLTYTPVQPCAVAATTIVNVTPSVTPVLGTATLCQSDPPFSLANIADPAYPVGTWSGPGVTGTVFSPLGLSGPVTLTFLSNVNCAVPVNTTLVVTPSATPQLAAASVCESENNFDLTALQDPAYPTGTWSGPGVSGNIFSAAGLTGTVTLTFTSNQPCTQPATTAMTVTALTAPALLTGSTCTAGGPFNLTLLQDPAFPNGTWSGPGVTGNTFNPAGQSGQVVLTFVPNTNCGLPATTTMTLSEAPNVAAPVSVCSPDNLSYTVTFNISAGDPASYTVNDQPSGPVFTSAPLPSGTPFSFQVDDGNGCGPVILNGSFDCACTTFAGSMNLAGSPFEVCSDAVFTATFNNNAVLDGDDVLLFVLHDSPGPSLGNVLAINTVPVFGLPANGVVGVTYYVSAVAGNNDGSGGFNPADGCLSVAAGVPVVFYEVDGSIGQGGSVCADDCLSIPLLFEGVAPFSFTYQLLTPNGNSNEVFIASQANAQLTICPNDLGVASGQITLQPIGLTDGNGCSISVSNGPNVLLEVLPEITTNLSQTLCPGESLTVNGTVYNEANPSGTELFPNGSAQGCDSIVNVNLSFYPIATGQLAQTLCTGGSLTVNGTVYNEANPSGTEVLANASANGCDSLVEVSLSFNTSVSFDLVQTLCPGESLTVNGTVYNEANPSGTELFPNGSAQGCDSIVNVSLSFYPIASGQLAQTLCTGGSLTVNGTVYNEANPSGTEVLANASANGCDSLVEVSLSFNSSVSFDLSQTLCPGESLTVNGTVYNEANPSGTELFSNGSVQGCDSIVNVSLTFLQNAVFELVQTLAVGGSITVNGTVYDASNPDGIEVLENAAANGCDSTILISLNFGTANIALLTSTVAPTCAGDTDGQIVLENLSGGSGSYTVSLDAQPPFPVGDLPFAIENLPPGNYELTISDGAGLSTEVSVNVPAATSILLELGDDVEVELGDDVSFNPLTNILPAAIAWEPTTYLDCNDCLDPLVVKPASNIVYQLTIADENGCTASDRVEVLLRKPRNVFVPNAFSPNGDGINDLLTVFAGSSVTAIRSFRIFDRWGEIVYEGFNLSPGGLSQGWDGTYKGKPLDPAVFAYFAEVEFLDGELQLVEGDVLLVR
ncbi:MAG: gliding motility-associated C-terminal domain-containing protein [Lewinellaceae bacterium]|nr:gliding motility-associated C-terminal domain-containing protein [Lewinellaceae bacterium]